MPDYGGPGGFGPGTTGGGEAATGGMGRGQGSGYGGGNGMSQATRDRLADMARTDITNTDVEVEKTRLAADRFAQRMQQEADVNNPVKYDDALRLHGELTAQNINPNQVSLENFTQGPFAQKNVVTHKGKRIGQFTSLPAFGLSGFLANVAGLDLRGLNLDQSVFGELDRGGRADERSVMEILYPSSPDAPGEGEDRGEGKAFIDDPIFSGYDLAFRDFYGQQLPTRGFQPMRNGGLASLPMNFNPMTNANPFSMMMQGGR